MNFSFLDGIFRILRSRPRKVGLALGGGAARGLAHLGVIKALKEHQVPIHFIAATSSGAIMGSLLAAGMDIKKMIQISKQLEWNQFARLTFEKTGPISGEAIEKFINNNIGSITFSELKIPLAVVATDLMTGKPVILSEGKVSLAVRASVAFPGVFANVRLNNRILVDGGVSYNVPVEVVKNMGAEVVIAVDVIPKGVMRKEPANIIEVIDRSVDLLLRKTTRSSLFKADIVIEPVDEYVSSIALEKASELIEMGERATQPLIPEIKAKVF